MEKTNNIFNLECVGEENVLLIVRELITNEEFFKGCLPVLDQNRWFGKEHIKLIVAKLRDWYTNNKALPTLDELENLCVLQAKKKGTERNYLLDEITDYFKRMRNVQDIATDELCELFTWFYRQQASISAINTLKDSFGYNSILEACRSVKDIMDSATAFSWGSDKLVLKSLPTDGDVYSILYQDTDKIPTGIPELDDILAGGGGIARKSVGIIGIPTGVGKTTLGINFGVNAALKGYKVLMFNFEDSGKSLVSKQIACRTHLNTRMITSTDPTVQPIIQPQIDAFVQSEEYQIISKNFMVVNPVETLNSHKRKKNKIDINAIVGLINKAIDNGFNPDLVILDYFDKLEFPANDRRWDAEKDAMNELERQSKCLDAGIWVFSQCVKTSDKGDPLYLSDIAGGSARTHPCAIGITVQKGEDKTKATFNILKNRDGEVKKFEDVTYDNATLTIDFSTATTSTLELSDELWEMGGNTPMTTAPAHKAFNQGNYENR